MKLETRPLTIDEIFAKPAIAPPDINTNIGGKLPVPVMSSTEVSLTPNLPDTVVSAIHNDNTKTILEKYWPWMLLGVISIFGIGFYLDNKKNKLTSPHPSPLPPVDEQKPQDEVTGINQIDGSPQKSMTELDKSMIIQNQPPFTTF